MTPRTQHHPRLIREVLAYADQHSAVQAARKWGLHHCTVYRWRNLRTELGASWPTDQDIAAYDATAPERRHVAAQKRDYMNRRYLNRGPILMDATGTIRRLQALGALGHTQKDIGRELNLSDARISQIARGTQRWVRPDTAAAVADLYRRWARIAPAGKSAAYARTYAKAKGWHSPIAWNNIDDPKERPRGGVGTRPRRKQSQVAA